MKRAVILQHVESEGPGRIAPILTELGFTLTARTLKCAADVPDDLDAEDLLVVMGGPMGVGDLEDPKLAFLKPEVELLKRRIAGDAPVLGVCLGAQLIAHAAGAAVLPMVASDGRRLYEVGWGPVAFHPAGNKPVLEGVPLQCQVVHWHGDHFELPPRARLLASSPLCKQGFRLGERIFGLQFHCELDASQIEDFLRVDQRYVVQANGADGIERIRRDTTRYLQSFREVGDRLLRNIVGAMTAD